MVPKSMALNFLVKRPAHIASYYSYNSLKFTRDIRIKAVTNSNTKMA